MTVEQKTILYVDCRCHAHTPVSNSVRLPEIYFITRLCNGYSPNSTWLDSTRHVRRVEPIHFGCVELVEQHSSSRSTRRARLARLARHDELDWLDWLDTLVTLDAFVSTSSTRNLVCCVVCIKLYYCLLYTSPSPRDRQKSRMPSSA